MKYTCRLKIYRIIKLFRLAMFLSKCFSISSKLCYNSVSVRQTHTRIHTHMRPHMRTQYVEKCFFFINALPRGLALHPWPCDILSWLNSTSFWFIYFSSFYLKWISCLWFVNLLKKHKQYTETDFSVLSRSNQASAESDEELPIKPLQIFFLSSGFFKSSESSDWISSTLN